MATSKRELYAIEWRDELMTGSGGSSLVRVYPSRESAENTIKKHWPGVVDMGYKIIKFVEAK